MVKFFSPILAALVLLTVCPEHSGASFGYAGLSHAFSLPVKAPATVRSTAVCDEQAPLPIAGPQTLAAGTVKGVGTLGYGAPAPATPPPSSYGNAPGDYRRGYEGPSPTPGDPWHREGDFKARDYQFRHGPQPGYAEPPQPAAPPAGLPSPEYPSLPKPPLPGDRDMPSDSPTLPQDGR